MLCGVRLEALALAAGAFVLGRGPKMKKRGRAEHGGRLRRDRFREKEVGDGISGGSGGTDA
jgi:hypothetical protein